MKDSENMTAASAPTVQERKTFPRGPEVYKAQGKRIYKLPTERREGNVTRISVGFPVCEILEDYVGIVAAETVALMMNRAEAFLDLFEALRALLAANQAVDTALCESPGDPGFDPLLLPDAQEKQHEAEKLAAVALSKATGDEIPFMQGG